MEFKNEYEYKLYNSYKRVYGCHYSNNDRKPQNLLCKTINRDVVIPDGSINDFVDNMLLIAVSGFNLSDNMADEAKYIVATMWEYPNNFHDTKCELAALGALMYVVYSKYSEDITLDFSGFCIQWFGPAQAKNNIIQMYEAYGTVLELYPEVEKELAESEMRLRKIRYKTKYRKYCA